METFLQIVGVIFLVLLLIVGGVILFLVWKIKSWARQMSDQVQEFGGLMQKMGGGPMSAALGGLMEPLMLELSPTSDEPDEDFALQIDAWTKGLTSAGFVKVGDFDAEPTMLWVRGLIHPESGAAAALYVMPMAGAWYDVTAMFTDGRSVTLSDTQRELPESPPWATLQQLEEGTPPARAYEKLLRKIGEQEVQPYAADNFVAEFEEQYRKSTLWRVKRGDTPEELKRISAADMEESPNDEFVESLLVSRRQMRAVQIDEMLKLEWLKNSNMSAYEYERLEDRLVVIHELTPAETLVEAWGEMYGEGDEDEDFEERFDIPEVSDLVEQQGPQQAFRTLQQKLPPHARFEHFAAIEGDLAGDLWLRPESY